LDIDVVSDKHGSKVMFLVKHLLWLQMEDPGSKAVVFSTWKAGLSIIADAFQRNGIKYTRIDTVGKKANPVHDFEIDPTMQVLLLHG
jgi:E3 ubiquitin-protein ligase SHPRH